MTPAPPETGSGLLVLDKPPGWTSHQVVGRVRRWAGTRRVGHAGTLDPMATGVLLVGINRATRLLGHLALTDKTYTATVRLGQATMTDDAEGDVTAAPGAAEVPDGALADALKALRGDIWQVPSAVSAIKVNGVRSYAAVRAGREVALASRQVRVGRLEVTGRRDLVAGGVPVVDLDVVVDCSSGTYVRALARDLGVALGIGGHLTALRRTRVGPYRLAEAVGLDAEQAGQLRLLSLAEVARRSFATVTVTADEEVDVSFGRRLPGRAVPADPTALLSPAGEFLALYRPDSSAAGAGKGSGAVPVAVFAVPAG